MVHLLPLWLPTAKPSFPSFSVMVTITLQHMDVPILKREKLRDHLPLPSHWTIPSNTSWLISSLESGGSAYLLYVFLYFSSFLQRTPWIHPTWFISFQEGREGNCRINAYSGIAGKGWLQGAEVLFGPPSWVVSPAYSSRSSASLIQHPRVDLALGAWHPNKPRKRLISKTKMTI